MDADGNSPATVATASWVMTSDTIQGLPGNDVVRIAADSTSPTTTADVFINDPGPTPSYSLPLADASQWSISGSRADDLVVDFSNGSPIPTNGSVSFSGDASTHDNSLSIVGSSANNSVTVTPTQEVVNGQPINYSNVHYFQFNLGAGQDALIVDGATVTANVANSVSAGTAVTVAGGGDINLGGQRTTVRSLVVAGGTVSDGTFSATNGYVLQGGLVSAGLTGPGGLLKSSSATVTLSGNNSYSGPTIVTGGKLLVTSAASLPTGTSLYVGEIRSTTTVSASVNPSTFGQSVTFTATVTGIMPIPATASGDVAFFDGSTMLGTATLAANGQATFSTSALSTGSHTITATYSGDTNFAASASSRLADKVNPTSTVTSLAISSSSFVYGQQVTLTANVNSAPSGSGIPTGVVVFMAGSATIGSALLTSGTTILNTSGLPAGSDTITAVYEGDGVDFNGSSSAGIHASVSPAPLTITISSQTKVYGAAVPTLTLAYSGFVNGDTSSSLTAPPNVTTTATAASIVGSYPITASGAVDSNYTINYVDGTLSVTPAPLTIAANNASMAYDTALPIPFAVSFSGFVNGDTPASLTTPPTVATSATSASPLGTYPITASGAVDPNYTITYVGGTLTIAAALVSGVTPNAGPTAGGTAVTISGTNLSIVTAVYFGGTAAAGFALNANSQIVATSPASSGGNAGTVDITVKTSQGSSIDSPADQFRYVAAPIVTSVVNVSGGLFGTSVVEIYGSNLSDPTTAVFFATTPAAGFSIVSASEIIATSPPGAGNADVTVVNAGGTSAPLPAGQPASSPAGLALAVSSAPASTLTRSVSEDSDTAARTYSLRSAVMKKHHGGA